jgi:hypothetical protein
VSERKAWAAEAQGEVASTGARDRSQGAEVRAAVEVVVDVDEYSAVERGVEGFLKLADVAAIEVQPCGESAVLGFPGCDAERHRGQIGTGCVEAGGRAHQDVFPGATPDVEYAAPDGARFGEGLERRLWSADIRSRGGCALDATAALVNQHGLAAVTMSDIAKHAGIGRATLYIGQRQEAGRAQRRRATGSRGRRDRRHRQSRC